MPDVFLSYAKEDREHARRIAAVLESCGWSVFWDHKILPGDDWRQRVQSELDAAVAVVVLWTRASVDSTWVHEEAERGRARLISVLLDEVVLPIGFSRLQGLDLIGWQGGRAADVAKLVDAVAGVLRQPPKQQPTIPLAPSRKRLVAATISLIVTIVAGFLVARWLRTPPPIMNQEIVLDASSGMSAPFDVSSSKLAAAIEALRQRNLHPAENLALRAFGGPCQSDSESRLLVTFGTKRRARIMSATDSLTPQGQPTLVSGVISALADVHPLPNTRRIVVITGHADACYEEAIRELKQRFDALPATGKGKGSVALEMRFIGLALSAADEARVRRLSETVGGQAHFVRTVAQLNDVLRYVIEFEPAVRHVKDVWDVVDQIGKGLNDMGHSANARRFDEASKTLAAAETLYDDLAPSFEALSGITLSAKFERFYKLASENRVLQKESFVAARAWIRTGPGLANDKAPDFQQRVKLWNAAVRVVNEITTKYNSNVAQMNRLADEIVKETRQSG